MRAGSPDRAGPDRPFVVPLAIAVIAGVAAGVAAPALLESATVLRVGGAAAIAAAVGGAAGRSRTGAWLVLVATMVTAFAWASIRLDRVGPDDLAAGLREPIVVRARGVALGRPILVEPAHGPLARFGHAPPVTVFPMRVDTIVDDDGRARPARGRVTVRVEATLAPFDAGDAIEVTGRLVPVRGPRNPGEPDRRAWARSVRYAGSLHVPARGLVRVTGDRAGVVARSMRTLRERARERASAWLFAHVPPAADPRRDALLAALLTGRRLAGLESVEATFRRVGVAHMLAISGLHLGILAGVAVLATRLAGLRSGTRGLVVVAVVVAYLVVVEPRLPVLRAGTTAILIGAGLVLGRRWSALGVLALAAAGLALWRPAEVARPAFQLSFGVVTALIVLAPRLRARWFGPPDALAPTVARMGGQWLATSSVAAIVAWAIATPIVAFHFDVVSPAAPLVSLATLPVVAGIVAVGAVKMAIAAVLPSASLLAGACLALLADLLLVIVEAADAMPGRLVRVPHPSPAWSLVAVAVVTWWIVHRGRWQRRALASATVVLLAWLWWPAVAEPGRVGLTVDMLSVGDGTCIVVRRGRSTVVYDAGSTDPSVGARTLVPALRRLGVRRIDAVIVSHANLDHFAGLLAIADDVPVGEVVVTPAFIGEARADPRGPAAVLMAELARRRVLVTAVSAGERRVHGGAAWEVLHPPADVAYDAANDRSLVVRVEVAGRRLLLCGDIEAPAMIDLLEAAGRSGGPDFLRADVLELPHHGSHHAVAEAFVAAVDPSIVLQSTGRRRWERDRWNAALAPRDRLVTARDGAIHVVVEE